MTGQRSFALEVERFAQIAKTRAELYVTEFTFDLIELLKVNTPGPGNSIQVNPPPGRPTGNLRGSWYVTLDDPGESPGGRTDPTGANSVANIALTLRGFKLGDKIYVLNPTSYAPFLEFGTSKMAPRAFIRGTLASASSVALATAQRLGAGR